MKRVLVFGSFDPLHEGHKYLFREAKKLGDELLVIVSRDNDIQTQKKRDSFQSEQERLAAVASDPSVDKALLGDEDPRSYALLTSLSFDVLAVGYDQRPDDATIQSILRQVGKPDVTVVRLQPFKPDQYKSSFFRPN